MFDPPPASPQSLVRHYAGVLISVDPARLTEVRQTLDSTSGIAVHHLEPATGRCVAVLESADRAAGESLFDAVARLPHVRSIDLVYHLVDSDADASADTEFIPLEPKP